MKRVYKYEVQNLINKIDGLSVRFDYLALRRTYDTGGKLRWVVTRRDIYHPHYPQKWILGHTLSGAKHTLDTALIYDPEFRR